jgi:dolichol-phosphate mannosyltransferase
MTPETQPDSPTGGGRGMVSIILPTYNEAENIQDAARQIIAALGDPVEVIVVDDDSPDLTWQIAREMGDRRVKSVRRIRARGLASAINRGLIESQGDYVGWMDADLSHPPALLPALLRALEQADVAIASRYAPGGRDDRPSSRVWTSRLINRLARGILGSGPPGAPPVTDYDSGMILLHRRVLDSVTLMPSGYGAYFIEFIYHCLRKGLRVVEVPYTFSDRTRGTSKSAVNLLQFAAAGLGYVTRILQVRLRRED